VEGKRVEIDLLELGNSKAEKQARMEKRLVSCIRNQSSPNPVTKSVTFARKLIINEESLDKSMLERMEHNMEYNDDRIFEGLSIFEHQDEDEESKILEQASSLIVPENQSTENRPEGINGDSGNKDFTDIEQNQGILSNCEDSGAIHNTRKEPIFESQVSVIQCNDDPKEDFELANDFDELDFDKSDNKEDESIYMQLNDSLIKSREVLKDKNVRRESFKKMLTIDKKVSDSWFFRGDSEGRDSYSSNNIKAQNSFEAEKWFLESRTKSNNLKQESSDKLETVKKNLEFDPAVPSDDFFEEKGSESIIEQNDEESKFVDDSYSMVLMNSK